MRFQFNVHTEFDSLDHEKQYYASEALKAIQICEEKNLKLLRKQQESIEYPVILDERTIKKSI